MSEQTTFKTSLYEETRVTESDMDPAIPDLPLVSFDLNLKNLQDFLTRVASALNKNTLQIKILQEELLSKVSIPQVTTLVEKISSVMPSEFSVNNLEISNFDDLIATLTTGTEKMCEKIKDLEHFKEIAQSEIQELWEEVRRKVDKDDFDLRNKEFLEKIKEKVPNDQFLKKWKKMKNALKSQETGFVSKFSDVDKKFSELKTEFLWKINDIDRLLQTRVNEQFVWDAVEILETKLKKQRDIQASLKLSRQQSLFEKLSNELKSVESFMIARLETSEANLKDLTKELSMKVNKSTHENKISDILTNFQLKLDPQEKLIQKCSEKVESLEESLNLLTPRIPENIEETLNNLSSKTQEVSSKLDTKVEKDFMLHVISKLKPPKPEIIQNPATDLNDFWKFRDQTIKNFEKSDEKFDRIMKALDLGIFKRVLASKANESSTRDEFLSVGQRLINLERNQGEIFKELEKLNSLIRRLYSMIEEVGSTQSTFALISKKSFTGNCLSCGKGENSIIPTIPHVQGFDGRFYKADMNSFRPGHSSSDWKPEDAESRSKSPINRLPRAGLNSILGKDLVTSLSSTSINRPSSAKK